MSKPETVRELALALPRTTEGTSYGTAAYYVRRKLFARLLPEPDQLVIKMDPEQRELMIRGDSQTFFVTDHYLNHPMMIVRLSRLSRSELADLLREAWEHASS